MKYIKYAVLSILVIHMVSCDFLNVDNYFSEKLQYDSIFHNKRNLEGYLWNAASMFPEPGAFIGNNYTPGVLACDEAFILGPLSEYRGMDYVLGNVTPDNMVFSTWSNMYKVIRKANTILARMNEAVDLTSFDKIEINGYAHMLRAYAYYLILMDFGPVVIIGDDVLESNLEPEYYDRSRATYDESVDYICQELELAAKGLPLQVQMVNYGRPTRGTALALIARLRLQQASSLYNGGAAKTYYSDWTRTVDGVHYISQSYDEKKWAVAAAAAKKVIEMGLYSLHTIPVDPNMPDSPTPPANVSSEAFPNGAGGIDIFRSYADMFSGEAVPQKNPEVIWGCLSPSLQNYTRHSFPYNDMGGWNQLCLTQQTIDAFYMADGGTIENSGPYYTYNTDKLAHDSVFSGYTLKSSVHPMYVNREVRFYACVGFSGCFWSASSTTDNSKKNKIVTYPYNSGNAGKSAVSGANSDHYPATGYVIKKYIHPEDAWSGTQSQRLPKYFHTIRYAEILLSYVEAMNHLTQSHSFTDSTGHVINVSRDKGEMAKYFNQIRYRVGLPGLTDVELSDVVTMQRIIETERRVEFVYENRRYYDVRRWGQYEETESAHLMGMDMDSDAPGYYTPTPINHSRARNRVVNKRMVFLPLVRDEVRKASSLDQNPGWAD